MAPLESHQCWPCSDVTCVMEWMINLMGIQVNVNTKPNITIKTTTWSKLSVCQTAEETKSYHNPSLDLERFTTIGVYGSLWCRSSTWKKYQIFPLDSHVLFCVARPPTLVCFWTETLRSKVVFTLERQRTCKETKCCLHQQTKQIFIIKWLVSKCTVYQSNWS